MVTTTTPCGSTSLKTSRALDHAAVHAAGASGRPGAALRRREVGCELGARSRGDGDLPVKARQALR
eukprot:2828693-Pyramimonas_sp.AAC.1